MELQGDARLPDDSTSFWQQIIWLMDKTLGSYVSTVESPTRFAGFHVSNQKADKAGNSVATYIP